MISFSITDNVTPALQRMVRQCNNPLPGLKISGRAVGNLLRRHFTEKNQKANRLGGERTNYWLGVKRAVNNLYAYGPQSVTVAISHPSICQKVFGGTITAKRAGALTIPITAEAHGRRASVLERALGIKLFRLPNHPDVLAGIREGKMRPYYLLRKSVSQPPDPTALPPEEGPPGKGMRETAQAAFIEWLEREKQKAEKAPPVKR